MADQPPQRVGPSNQPSSSNQPHPKQHPLSCTHCRQRKIKCDRVHPCAPCQRSNRECVFPERVRHPKKKQTGARANNDELIRRLGRMEELIEKLKTDGKDAPTRTSIEARSPSSRSPSMPQIRRETSEGSRSQDDGSSEVIWDGNSRWIGSAFFRSLTNEVEGLKQTMDDVSDDEETEYSGQTPSDTQTPHTTMLFGSTSLSANDLRLLHPSPNSMGALCNIYAENCDPVFKILHIPSLQQFVARAATDVYNIPSRNYVEALLFAMYYAAITSLTPEQCSQKFQEGRETLLARYRMGTEVALSNADLLNTKEMGTLQALVIFLASVRSNDDSQFAWTMTSVAIRLAHSMGLHRESSKTKLSPFQTELHRRLWWQIIHLDIRCCEDRGSDPFIHDSTFNTKRPLNIHDSDMDPQTIGPIPERFEFTQMTKTHIANIFWSTAMKIAFDPPVKEGEEKVTIPFDQKVLMVEQLEKRLENEVLVFCNPSNILAWVTAIVVRLVMARHRLAIYHPPMHDDRSPDHQNVSRDKVLETAVQIMEYAHSLDMEPAAAKWRWYFKTHVQWHALAATLAELSVQNKGPLVERAWMIVDTVFDDWAARIADSSQGMLWRPIKKLMKKAQSRRDERKASSPSAMLQQQQPLPPFGTPFGSSFVSPQDQTSESMPYHPNSVLGLSQKHNLGQGLPPDILATLNVNDPTDAINWAGWDEFMQDFEMTDPAAMYPNAIQQDASYAGEWW